MTAFTITPATKKNAKARIAIAGPSGSGKTWTGLMLATNMCKRVVCIDTEHGSSEKYAGEGPGSFQFDHLPLTRYEPQTLVAALAHTGSQGYDGVLIDSLSHFWMGTGGIRQQVDDITARSRSGNSFSTGWKEIAPVESAMIEAMLAYPGHVFVTMRTKTEWVIEEDDRGKKAPRKIGLKPEQRAGIEYEFDIVGDLDQQNTLVISKSRCMALHEAVIRKPGPEFAETILGWLSDGKDSGDDVPQYVNRVIAAEDKDTLLALFNEVKSKRLEGAAVMDGTGEPTTLGQFIVARGKAFATAAAREGAAQIKAAS